MIIYKVTNLKNGKIYIGQTITTLDNRRNGHLKSVRNGSETVFHRAISKYGIDNFKWEILEEFNNIDELNVNETLYIRKFGTFIDYDECNGYNMTEGGDNCSPSEITKQKLRELYVGKTWDELHGIELSNKYKRKLSNKLKTYHNDHVHFATGKSYEELYGIEGAKLKKIKMSINNIGKHDYDEVTREKCRQHNIGKKRSKTTREKISESLRGKPGRNTGNTHSDETKQKISKSRSGIPAWNKMTIIQCDLNGTIIKEWDSIIEAQTTLKIRNISSVINGNRQTAGGFKWTKKI